MVEKYLISQPLAMVGAFLVLVAIPLLYEVAGYLRTRTEEASQPAPAPAVVPLKKKRR